MSWSNWAGNVRCEPRLRVAAASEAEVVAALREAEREGLGVRVVGSGHSFSPLVATDGLLLSLDDLAGIARHEPEERRVWVRAGTKLHDLGAALHALGLALENLGDVDVQSLGGALATGTHGTGRTLPNLSARVSGLRLLLADRRACACCGGGRRRPARRGARLARRARRGDRPRASTASPPTGSTSASSACRSTRASRAWPSAARRQPSLRVLLVSRRATWPRRRRSTRPSSARGRGRPEVRTHRLEPRDPALGARAALRRDGVRAAGRSRAGLPSAPCASACRAGTPRVAWPVEYRHVRAGRRLALDRARARDGHDLDPPGRGAALAGASSPTSSRSSARAPRAAALGQATQPRAPPSWRRSTRASTTSGAPRAASTRAGAS